VSFIKMTSLWRHLSTINMATLPLKASHKEHCSAIHFLWAKRRYPNTIHSKMCPVYGDKCLTRPAIHIWCKKFACGRKVLSMKKIWPTCCFNDWCSDCSSRVSNTVWPACIDKCSNKFGQYVDKQKVDVWHLNRFNCWTHSFFWYS